jgi:hypothetical protein
MSFAKRISRRCMLRGMGTAIALPLLDAMGPVRLWADQRKAPGAAVSGPAAAPALPRRMAFVYVPNGMHMPDWTPALAGEDFELPFLLEPLDKHKPNLTVISGLMQDHARPHGDGPGDHARSLAAFLTGCQPLKTKGSDIKVGVSVDQVAAQQIGDKTRLASLELGCDRGQQAGNCDSGYSCAYSSNMSWRSESTPMPKEVNPRLVFERLFGGAEEVKDRAKRSAYRSSVLDFVLEDARQLQARLGAKDRRKVDEYFNSVREVENRIARAEKAAEVAAPDYPKPSGMPKDYGEHIRLMYDLLTLAFQTDATRISTFVVDNEGSNRSYNFLKVPEGHHELSHHGKDPAKQAKIRQINRFHLEQFAYFIDKLSAIPEGPGTLLDNCMVLYGSGISDGDRHNHNELPIVLVGRGGGSIRGGRHLLYKKETPLNNLYLAMLDRMQASVDALGDSNGTLTLNA